MPARANSSCVTGLPSRPRSGLWLFGNARARYFPVALPLSTGLSARPSYSSTPPRSFTHSMRARLRPFSTSISTPGSVYGPVVSYTGIGGSLASESAISRSGTLRSGAVSGVA